MCMASLIFNWKLVEAESRILKQTFEQREQQFSEPLKCKNLGMFFRGEMFMETNLIYIKLCIKNLLEYDKRALPI